MLSLSQPAAPRCRANPNSSRSSTRATTRLLHVCTVSTATSATVSAVPNASSSPRPRRNCCSNLNLRQRSARRELLRPLAAVPGDRESGAHPESGTGSSGTGRIPEERNIPGGQQGNDVSSAPESGTRPEYEVASGTSTGGSTAGMTGGQTHMQSSSGSGTTGSSERATDDFTAATGGQAPSSKQSPALNQRTRAPRTDDLSGTVPGGPQDVLMGQGVPTSDTHPDMDPSESRLYAERESTEAGSMKEQFVSSSSEGQHGRDESDKQSGAGHSDSGGSSSSSTRAHPAARTAAMAIGSAAGTVLGAVGGPVGAAAGAAIGGGVGRNIADVLGGHTEQAEIYDQGAEPEQVAEEAMAAGDAALRATGYVAEDIREAASKAQAAASDLIDRASERLSDSSTSGGSSSSTANDIRDRPRADLDADRAGQADVQGGIGSSVEYKSGDKGSTHDKGGHNHSHKGVVGQVKGKVTGAAKSAVNKVASATEGIPLPTFPPETGKEDNMYASQAGSFVGDGDTATERGAAAVGDRLQGAAKAAVDKVSSAAEGLELPTFPPATGNDNDMYASAAASFVGEGGTAVEQGPAAAGDRLQGVTEVLRDSLSGTARTAAARMPSGEGRGGDNATAAAAAAEGLEDSEARAAQAGWGDADRNKEWGGVGDWTNAEAAVKSAVGTPIHRRDAPSMMQSDNMDLTQMVSAASMGGKPGASQGDPMASGSAQAAGGYGGGSAGEFNIDSVREMSGQLGGGTAELMSAQQQDRSSSSATGSTAGGVTGVAAVDEGLPEGKLAAGGPDAQAAMGAERGESSSETTSDSTAERVAQVYGVPPEASPGKEEADTYRAEAGQEGST